MFLVAGITGNVGSAAARGLLAQGKQVRAAGPHLAMQRAYSELATTLTNQAQPMAFADDFRYLAVMSMGCAAAVFILKKTKPVVGAG